MNDIIDDDVLRGAMAPYRRVKASDELRRAVTEPSTPSPADRPWVRRHPRLAVGGAAAALSVAALVVALLVVDRSGSDDTTTVDLSDAQAVVFADGTTVDVEELFFPANYERLKQVFAEHGAELEIVEVPVGPAGDGDVLAVSTPAAMTDGPGSDSGDIHLDAGGRVRVEIGRFFHEVDAAIVRDDPEATGRALEQLGFEVYWQLVDADGRSHNVDEPPPGTVVIGVGSPDDYFRIDRSSREVDLEIAPPDVAGKLATTDEPGG